MQRDIVDSVGVPVGAYGRDEPVIVFYLYLEDALLLLELQWNLIGEDQVRPRTPCLIV